MSDKTKGVATALEFLAVIGALFIAFNIFFPGPLYKSNWDDAYAVLLSRDILASLVATDDIYSYMSDEAVMQNFFDTLFPVSNYVLWYNMEGIKERINVACDCTSDQMDALDSWSTGLRVNDRDIGMFFCQADLGNPESACIEDSDALVIWDNRNLDEQTLTNYLLEGGGIVEITDFTLAEQPDAVQQNIFGIAAGGSYSGTEDEIPKPDSVDESRYGPYKLFYHMPLTLYTTQTGNLTECQSSRKGTLNMTLAHSFWTCNDTYVFFDTVGDGLPDHGPLREGNTTTIEGSEFNVSHIDGMASIRVTFLDTVPYVFDDFVRVPASGQPVVPYDGDESRVFLQMDGVVSPIACGIVLNTVYDGKTVWVADFGRNGLEFPDVGDDHKQMALSLLIWASNRRTGSDDIPDIQRGHTSSYVEVSNIDVFEIQRYEIGVGSPY